MILSQIAWVDCIAFVIFLIPRLLISTKLLDLTVVVLKVLPFLFIQLPATFVYERYIESKHSRPPFVQQASAFQDFVTRCVRYAFAKIPANVGRVFFSKEVALPFLRFRMFRHGILRSPTPWEEIDSDGVRGILISHDRNQCHDIVVYYVHGGGFSMGSAYFYLEPLIVLHTLLQERYRHPSVFALEYDLVPDRAYPTQATQVTQGYHYAATLVGGDCRRIVVSGDSAGGTLVLSLLLKLSFGRREEFFATMPGFAALLSPWVTLVSDFNQNTRSDYLNAESLHLYGSQYAGPEHVHDPEVSPGRCTSLAWWKNASPEHGFYITYGSEEVFGPEIRNFIRRLRKAGVDVSVKEEPGAVHAWVIASLFLAGSKKERLQGMREVVKAITANIDPLEKCRDF